ncbi:RDD family protein [Thioalkalivibrio sp. ALE11]|uniref:RDD family protein n=1 Tax=Thioalkalivibrio sp. ALE11 TaxID=1265494 RepID=UPI00039ECBDB|nr:RDD family protein [Thioalkalivibrio sp. ALE11]
MAVFCTQCGTKAEEDSRYCGACGAKLPVAETVAPGSTAVSRGTPKPDAHRPQEDDDADRFQHAGFWYRFLAWIIDYLILFVGALFIVFPIGFIYGWTMSGSAPPAQIESEAEVIGNIIGIMIWWLYWTLFESSDWQGTPGKRMLGLRVTDEEGRPIGFGRANARYWSKILSTIMLFIGFLMIAFTRRKQGLHDIIAATLVLRR